MIVPKSLHKDMKHLLHVGHVGIVRIKEKACDILYCSGIDADLENIIVMARVKCTKINKKMKVQ